MIDGLWTVHFEAPGVGSGTGVAVLMNGKLFGGDSGFMYIGSYSVSGDTITAEVNAKNFEPRVPNLLGMSSYTVNLRGKVNDAVIDTTGTVATRPGVTLSLRLQKQAPL